MAGNELYSAAPGTSDAALYAAGTGGQIVVSMFVSNATGSAATLTLSVHRAVSGDVEPWATALSVAAGDEFNMIDPTDMPLGGIELMSGDSIHGSQGTANAITVTLTSS